MLIDIFILVILGRVSEISGINSNNIDVGQCVMPLYGNVCFSVLIKVGYLCGDPKLQVGTS